MYLDKGQVGSCDCDVQGVLMVTLGVVREGLVELQELWVEYGSGDEQMNRVRMMVTRESGCGS